MAVELSTEQAKRAEQLMIASRRIRNQDGALVFFDFPLGVAAQIAVSMFHPDGTVKDIYEMAA